MNEDLNLVKKLKFCPKGTKFYSRVHGEIAFEEICSDKDYPILFDKGNKSFTKEGKLYSYYEGAEVILFPSKINKDWSTVDWSKKDLPIDTPVLVTDYMPNKCESGKYEVSINRVYLRLYAGGSETFKDSSKNTYSWNHIIPLDGYQIKGDYIVFKPEDDYGTEAYK